MAEDIAKLGLYVDSDGVVRATKRLKELEKQGGRTERGAQKLSKGFGMLKAAAGAFIASLAVKHIVDTNAAFESMKVSLETVTGSADKATAAFDGILKFASKTPFQVSEITDAFIKMKALGLQPTEAALTSFGNTSSAMGKSLNQMIEAVADAATGEFERLKEFGIKASSEGDKVKFTFQGVTTEVKKSAADITQYLQSIGQTQFAGAMEKQMSTVSGAFSNAKDAIDQLIVSLGESGLNKVVVTVTTSFTNMVRAIKEFIDPSTATQMQSIKERMIEIGEQINKRAAKGHGFNDLRVELERLTAQYNALKGDMEKQKTLDDVAAGGGDAAAQAAAEDEKKRWDEINRVAAEQQEIYRAQSILAKQKENEEIAELQRIANEQMILEEVRAQNAAAEAQRQYQEQRNEAITKTFVFLGQLTSSSSKKLFNLGKAASIASALINTYQAVTKTMSATPYPWNIPLAAAQMAAGMVQVQNIKAQKFSGQAHSGMDYVRSTGSYYLEKGEMVVDKGTSAKVRQGLQGAGGANITFAPVIQAFDADEVGRNNEKLFEGIRNQMVNWMHEEGYRFA